MMQPLVLASQSAARRRLLQSAGYACAARPAHVDEAGLKAALLAEDVDVETAALTLAEAKARKISAPGALVIAADQMLDFGGEWLDKPANPSEARRQIERLAGRTHHLVVGAVIFENGAEIWRVVTRAMLTMRSLGESQLDDYLAQAGTAALSAVGAYQIEGVGLRLFTRIDGDLFTIQGLPLLQISGFLQDRGFGFSSS